MTVLLERDMEMLRLIETILKVHTAESAIPTLGPTTLRSHVHTNALHCNGLDK